MNNDNGMISLVPVLSKLSPSDLSAIVAEDRGMGSTVFPRGDFLAVLALEIDNINLDIQSAVKHEGQGPLNLTFCLVCHAGGSSGSNVVYTTWVSETSKSSFPPKGSTGEL